MNYLDINTLPSILCQLKQIMDEHRDRLIALDRDLGDGDLGLTMTKAFTAAHETAATSRETLPGKLLMLVGMAMAKAAPSTMGTLVATGFMRGGKAIGEQERIGVPQLAAFFRAFTDGIMERGKTGPGNKTVVDALNPAAESLEQAAAQGKQLSEALAAALEAAARGNEAARMMKSQHGKAAVYHDQTIGKEDPGASVGVLIVQGFARTIENHP
ncbi:MAG: DAK2 domain-containing protein [Planctomycetes bacterium]|nr:DAK2 domain-containing protein [Planctomycetota bacterium]